jgi:hypothetical protein
MKPINHLVIAARDLDRLGDAYREIGFTTTPRGQHPFGTGNIVIQLHGTYLELLAVTRPEDVVEHRGSEFSFSAFNRDYLAGREGMSMLVFGSGDAAADSERWKRAGLRTYDPFGFSRAAKLPNGEEITVGFSLAFTSLDAAPWLGVFACQHLRPDYYAQPDYLRHSNTAHSVHDVWISGEDALALETPLSILAESALRYFPGIVRIQTAGQTIVLATPDEFEREFGLPPPHAEDGPHLSGFGVTCTSAPPFGSPPRYIVPPERTFGCVVSFVPNTARD